MLFSCHKNGQEAREHPQIGDLKDFRNFEGIFFIIIPCMINFLNPSAQSKNQEV